jgi:hypothetical protein
MHRGRGVSNSSGPSLSDQIRVLVVGDSGVRATRRIQLVIGVWDIAYSLYDVCACRWAKRCFPIWCARAKCCPTPPTPSAAPPKSRCRPFYRFPSFLHTHACVVCVWVCCAYVVCACVCGGLGGGQIHEFKGRPYYIEFWDLGGSKKYAESRGVVFNHLSINGTAGSPPAHTYQAPFDRLIDRFGPARRTHFGPRPNEPQVVQEHRALDQAGHWV